MSDLKRQMKLGLSLGPTGSHKAGWRHPDAYEGISVDFDAWTQIALAAERGKFHYVFFADGQAVRHESDNHDKLSYQSRIDQFEPLTLIAGLAARTTHLGYVATASTSYNEPYTIARKFASLDQMSGGRVAWNVVTTWSEVEAKNFSRDKNFEHGQRYRRAEEFVDIVRGLWDSWEDGAFIRDKESGRYFDPEKLHILHHKGEHFSVRGPLNVVRSPQGHPVLAQAGGSGPGQDLGARVAEIVYTAQKELAGAVTFYDSLKGRLGKFGRTRDSLNIMPGAVIVMGKTAAEARARMDQLNALLHPVAGLESLEPLFGDLSGYDLDGPPPRFVDDTNAVKSGFLAWQERLKRQPMSIRQIYESIAMGQDHREVVGTAASVADQLEEWFEAGACDGFSLMVPYMPTPLYEIVDLLVPELQRRGLFRMDYEGKTLRENMGLPRPVNRFASA